MIVRLWRTLVERSRRNDYEHNERNRSTPMFLEQPGCLGVLFLRSGDHCFALTFWQDWDAVNRLKASPSYLQTVAFYGSSGMLVGEPSLEVFEVQGGFLNDALLDSVSTHE